MMNNGFFIAALLIVVFAFYHVESSVSLMEVEIGKEAVLEFGKKMILIKRKTEASPNPQYLFSSPKQDGTWTTDGEQKIKSTAHLYWNGTLIFKKISKNDLGSYEMPLEPSRIKVTPTGASGVGQTVLTLVLKQK